MPPHHHTATVLPPHHHTTTPPHRHATTPPHHHTAAPPQHHNTTPTHRHNAATLADPPFLPTRCARRPRSRAQVLTEQHSAEELRAEEDEVRESGGALEGQQPAVTRRRVNMSELSGGSGVSYLERPRGKGGGGKGGKGGKGGGAGSSGGGGGRGGSGGHALFKQREAAQRKRQKMAAADQADGSR